MSNEENATSSVVADLANRLAEMYDAYNAGKTTLAEMDLLEDQIMDQAESAGVHYEVCRALWKLGHR